MASIPTLIEEMRLRSQGYRLVAGVDEAGRGPLAGPVVAGAVILPAGENTGWLHLSRDCKQLTPPQREEIFPLIHSRALAVGVGVVSVEEIDRMGIGKASLLAMRLAVEKLPVKPDFLLVDAFKVPDLDLPQKGIVKGDETCLSIAAASIIAKVTRDRLMVELDGQHPGYGFAKHKGYPTQLHMDCLVRLGPSPVHRRSFAPVRDALEAAKPAGGESDA